MTHWYGWIALSLAALFSVNDVLVMTVGAWRGAKYGTRVPKYGPIHVALWVTIAIALVVS